ncbi:hypothetical protein FRC02_009617 [Tulasnella sp. 418]|nr:hypothetical protein FRC02_009617 [Tulasnella sp. 418]
MRSNLLKTIVAISSASVAAAATVCNGYAELCSKPYSSVSVVGAHNSYTNSPTNLAANQDYDGARCLFTAVSQN